VSAHLPVLPILWPLLVAGVLLLAEGRGMVVQRAIAWVGLAGLLLLAVALVRLADGDVVTVYLVGDWPARLGIALMVDRLAAWMVLVTALLAAACLLHAGSGWDRRASHFHALFQLQLMGLNGAFLTGDLFNLFVFFEVLLCASYGLLLSGGRGGRIRVGFHYIAFNIAASTLFLIALGLIYGLLGSLNMVELAARVRDVAPSDRPLLLAIAGLLLVVFCGKAAIVPMYLWLPGTYGRAPAAIAALFVIMTKVGLYSVLRVFTLLFGAGAGELAGFAWTWLLPAGIATVLVASFGALAAIRLRILSAFLVLVSAGTLFIAFALARADSIGAGLYYLAHSTFACAALFLITALVRRHRVTDRMNILLGIHRPGLLAGYFLVLAVAVVGLPPLSGFIGKLQLLASVPPGQVGWVWMSILLSSLFVLVAMARAGERLFWRLPTPAQDDPAMAAQRRGGHGAEHAAICLLLAYLLVLTIAAAPAVGYTFAAGEQLLRTADYTQAVREARPLLREP
jgi:multicomponent K+:H+ antiporter subunit D